MKQILQQSGKVSLPLFVFLFLTLGIPSELLFSQESPIKWGEVPPPDILMTTYEPDTAAEAVVLCDYAYVEIFTNSSDYGYYRYHHKRVKILDKSAFDRGNISIPYYSHNGLESIRDLKAQVISPAGQITELSKKDFYTEVINDYWSSINFSFANLQEGSVFEYKYELHSQFMEELRTWYFQEDIPVRWSEYRVNNQSYFAYALLFEGGDYMNQSELPDGGTLFHNGETKIHILNGRYIMENAPALQEEGFITTMNDYRARIRFQLSEVIRPGGYHETYMSTWEELADELLQDSYFGERFLKRKNYKKLVEEATPAIEAAGTVEEKIRAAYHFVANQVNWNEHFGLFTDRSLDDAFETKLASAAEMNMMCLAILNHFEIPATPLLTSTRTHGKMTRDYPIRKQFNHLMILAEVDGKPTILDVGDPLRPMGLPRLGALNKMAWKVDTESPNWIEIVPILTRESLGGGLEISPEGDIHGSIRATYYTYSAYAERANHRQDAKGDYWKERLGHRFEDVRIDSIHFANVEDTDERFTTTVRFTYPDAIDMEADILYFSPILLTSFPENPFKLKERAYPVDFPYIFEEKYIMSIKVPEQFEVDELPETVNFSLPDDKGRFVFSIDQKGDRIQLISQLFISQQVYTPDEYPAIKELFDLLVEKHGEQIVFKRKT